MIRSITAPAFSLCFGVVGARGETKKKPWLYPHPNHETSALASFGLPKGQVEPEWVQWCFPKTEKVIKDIGMVHWLFYICFVCCPVWDFFLRFFLRLWEWATVTVINLKFLLVVGLWELWLFRKAPDFQALASKYNSWYNPVPKIDAYSFLPLLLLISGNGMDQGEQRFQLRSSTKMPTRRFSSSRHGSAGAWSMMWSIARVPYGSSGVLVISHFN